MLFHKLKNKLSFKNKPIIYLVAVLLIFFSLGAIFTFYHTKSKQSAHIFTTNKGEWITVTVSNTQNKSDLWLINTKTQTKQKLLNNKDVEVTGKVNAKGNILLYSDAIGTNPWDIFKLDIKSNETYQITNDPLGQFNVHFGDEKGNIIFAKNGGKSSPIPQISKIDVNKKEVQTFILGSDIGVEDFDVRNNKIIAITFSFNEFLTKRIKQQDSSSKMKYSIKELDFSGNVTKDLKDINAVRLDSISFSKSGKAIILGGKGMLKDETGFYKLDLKESNLTTLLTEGQLKDIELSQPYIACLSSNEQDIYFAANPTGTKPKDFFGGITAYPNALYSYNLKEKQIRKIFKVPDTFISSISSTYQ
ncbi:hypothetical protein [Clostridium tetanomorphum]|uniref:Uncharacterized protein n=1 Tax=Clostridium tetanomorphum TaxID=1553 RepID=A0A923J364_CLOTT|nr:hypothetical protein [Clostridium tetanomorphum]MBC2399758.1 hypothetical protein [Clostridium tetanomorphum]NRZ96900.1 hypothetical protein [Clostridium tetanomorphum]